MGPRPWASGTQHPARSSASQPVGGAGESDLRVKGTQREATGRETPKS